MDLLHSLLPVDITEEMKRSYIDYAMSVIIGRALPDVRDGLKPVHRRILYAMNELGNQYNKAYKKSARVVGDVIGKYHPHGDSAVYDALVRMAQDFSMRYMLVNGQGNFGSVDGDTAAAMRYTEVRLQRISSDLLADIDKDTVDFGPNYDGSLMEPLVMPTRFPNLLVNGSSGIAVGMATNVPPHNLTEVVDALLHLIENPEATNDDLMQFVPGPDFPTGGFICGRAGINEAYKTGRGIIRLRARTHIEQQAKGDKESIIVTELPYQVNKARLIEEIAHLVRDKKLEGIADLRDESDREGMRIYIELKRDADAGVTLTRLYKLTAMESSFGINFLAIVNGQPKTCQLRELMVHFLAHRVTVVTRRTRFDLAKAKDRAHILEGYLKALDHLDEVIALIRGSRTTDEAKVGLIGRFDFSEVQAQAILDMRLARLTGLERDKIVEEYRDILKLIEELEGILGNRHRLMQVIAGELREIKKDFGDARRTEILDHISEINAEDLLVEEDNVITVSHAGYIKRNPSSLYAVQHRGGKGKQAMGTKEEDFVESVYIGSTKDYLLIFTNTGKLYWLKVHEIPQASRAAKGKPIVNLIPIQPGEKIASVVPIKDFSPDVSIVTVTKKGIVKRTALEAYSNVRANGIIGCLVDEGDCLLAARVLGEGQYVYLCTANGLSIRFEEKDVREMGRASYGVIGIRLDLDDTVVAMEVLNTEDPNWLLTVTEMGFGKRTLISEYPIQGRAGRGVITIKTTTRNGRVIGVRRVEAGFNAMLITNGGNLIRIPTDAIPEYGRNTQGVKLMDLPHNVRLVDMTLVAESEETGEEIPEDQFELELEADE